MRFPVSLRSLTPVAFGTLILCAGLGEGCAKKAPTALMVAVQSEMATPTEIDGFEMEITRGDSTPFYQFYRVGKDGDATLPGTLALSNENESADKPVTVVIRAKLGGKDRVLRRATLGFSEGKTKLLRMPIRYSCADFADVCPPGQSCQGNECAPDAIDVETLPDFVLEQVFGEQGSGTCFDDRDTVCFANRQTVSLGPVAASSDCTVTLGALPAGDAGVDAGAEAGPPVDPGADGGVAAKADGVGGGGLNVAVQWGSSGNKVLDQDPREGWIRTGSGFRLAPGLCQALKKGRITAMSYSTSCAAKAPEVPVCQVKTSGDEAAASCSTYAQLACTRLIDCTKASVSQGTAADCTKSLQADCSAAVKLAGAPSTYLSQCVAELQNESCTQLANRMAADTLCSYPGGLPDGAGCVADLQCKSMRCSGSFSACGVCQATAKLGASCATTTCEPGAKCVSSKCVAAPKVGDACTAATESTACGFVLDCVANKCAIPTSSGTVSPVVGVGSPCGTDVADCDSTSYCSATTSKCVATLPVGSPCKDNEECGLAKCLSATGKCGVLDGSTCTGGGTGGSGTGGSVGAGGGPSGGAGGGTGAGGSGTGASGGGAPVSSECLASGWCSMCATQSAACKQDAVCNACLSSPTATQCATNNAFLLLASCSCGKTCAVCPAICPGL